MQKSVKLLQSFFVFKDFITLCVLSVNAILSQALHVYQLPDCANVD